MGNCFKGSSNDDFTRLRTEEQQEPMDNNRRRDGRNSTAHRTRVVREMGRQSRPMMYHPNPGIQRHASQLTEDEQVKVAQRLGLIQHLPTGLFDLSSKKNRECAICMIDYEEGDQLRFLPCLHTYHKDCVDDWLMRSFTCPSCMEPVDAGLLSSFDGY